MKARGADSPWGRRLGRRQFVRATALAGAATGVVSLAACAPASSGAVAPPPATAAPANPAAAVAPTAAPQIKYGGAFRAATQSDTPNLDPHLNSTSILHAFGPGVAWSKLLMYRTDVKPGETIPTGDLAESWTQPDDVTYVFKLRGNAKFQNIAPVNDRPVVAEDVKYSFERQIASKLNAGRLPAIAKIEVVDPATVKIVAPKPDADFLESIAYTHNKVVPRESVELKGDLKEGPIIGSGPWIYEKWERDKVASLVKNPDYYFKGFPRIDRLDLLRITDSATVFAGFRGKELDAVTGSVLTEQDADQLTKSNPDVVHESYKNTQGVTFFVNSTRPPFNDIRVRQAIFKAIDKQQIMDTVFGGRAWYFVGLRLPAEDYYLPEAEMKALYKQDLAEAKRLLTAAGVGPDREFEIYILGFGTTYKDSAELVQSDLKKIGLNTRLRISDTNTNFSTAIHTDASYDIAVGSALPVSANIDLFSVYYSGSNRNAGKVKDPALEALIDKQAVMVKDPEGRKKILLDIQRQIVNNAQAVHLVGVIAPSVRWKYVKDYFYAWNLEETFPQLWLDK
jgi:peptide/nickel transport system substrate-binding protein